MYKPMMENHLCKCLADLSCNIVTMYLIRIQDSAKFLEWINWMKGQSAWSKEVYLVICSFLFSFLCSLPLPTMLLL